MPVTKVIPSYLYLEYSDDEDLQAFVAAFNQLAQVYVTAFNEVGLPDYTSPVIIDLLLDWVAEGLYGYIRPVLSTGGPRIAGPLNTLYFNQLRYNQKKIIQSGIYYATTDDVFKRCITWHFFKGDGKTFNIRWLKRRIQRFLIGENGTSPNIDETYQISVVLGPDNTVFIQISAGLRTVVGGAILNRCRFNQVRFNELDTIYTPGPPIPTLAVTLKEAIDSGVLELPFQYTYTVVIG